MGDMSTVAEQLRQGREARSLTVQQVAEITKVRSDHIRAVEEGNYEVFSATVYVRGFVRSYASLLKLDVPQIMVALDQELERSAKFAEPPPLAKRPRNLADFLMLQLSQVAWRQWLIALGAVALFIAALWGWVAWRHHDPLKKLSPGRYPSAPDNWGETLPLPPAPRSPAR